MASFSSLLRDNPNYRNLWLGQIVSEVGDHFNSIAVLSLTYRVTGSGFTVGMVMIARALPAMVAGPISGVLLDRWDRRRIMLWSDLFRAVVAAGFILVLTNQQEWLLYLLSGLLMFASPFFTSGRSSILPSIAEPDQLHTANAMTQTTAWLTLSLGAMLGGMGTDQLGYEAAFGINSASFLASALAVWQLKSRTGSFRPERRGTVAYPHPLADLKECFQYMKREPLILAIALASVGWASGGGAAQILFTLFGEVVYQRGPAGIGLIWGFAGVGLVIGGFVGHRIGPQLSFERYKWAIAVCFLVLGGSYMTFSQMPTIWGAVVFITISRIAMGTNNVLNRTMLLTHVPDGLRGRVFSSVEMLLQATMMISMAVAAVATNYYGIRTIGFIAGALSASTGVFWTWANASGKLREPRLHTEETEFSFEEPVTPA